MQMYTLIGKHFPPIKLMKMKINFNVEEVEMRFHHMPPTGLYKLAWLFSKAIWQWDTGPLKS